MKIEDGCLVSLDVSMYDAQGQLLERTDSPLVYLHGAGDIFPRIEAALAGQEAPARGQRAHLVRRPAAYHPAHQRGQGAAARRHQRQALVGRSRGADVCRGRLARLRRGELVGRVGAGGTPKPQVERLHGDLVKAMGNPDLRERFVGMGVEAMATTPEALREFTRAETEKWGKVIREAGIRAY